VSKIQSQPRIHSNNSRLQSFVTIGCEVDANFSAAIKNFTWRSSIQECKYKFHVLHVRQMTTVRCMWSVGLCVCACMKTSMNVLVTVDLESAVLLKKLWDVRMPTATSTVTVNRAIVSTKRRALVGSVRLLHCALVLVLYSHSIDPLVVSTL